MPSVKNLDVNSFALTFAKVGLFIGFILSLIGLIIRYFSGTSFENVTYDSFSIIIAYGVGSYISGIIFAVIYNKFFNNPKNQFQVKI